jgi:hypothetical protein
MWALWSQVRFVDSGCAVQARGPADMSHLDAHSGTKEFTFFCSRTTLVHFFSSNPSYFFRVASSKAAEKLTSSRNAAAVLGALMTPRYAIMALWLPHGQYGVWWQECRSVSQLFGLAVGQYGAHGGEGLRLAHARAPAVTTTHSSPRRRFIFAWFALPWTCWYF